MTGEHPRPLRKDPVLSESISTPIWTTGVYMRVAKCPSFFEAFFGCGVDVLKWVASKEIWSNPTVAEVVAVGRSGRPLVSREKTPLRT